MRAIQAGRTPPVWTILRYHLISQVSLSVYAVSPAAYCGLPQLTYIHVCTLCAVLYRQAASTTDHRPQTDRMAVGRHPLAFVTQLIPHPLSHIPPNSSNPFLPMHPASLSLSPSPQYFYLFFPPSPLLLPSSFTLLIPLSSFLTLLIVSLSQEKDLFVPFPITLLSRQAFTEHVAAAVAYLFLAPPSFSHLRRLASTLSLLPILATAFFARALS